MAITEFGKKIEEQINMQKQVTITFPLNAFKEFSDFAKEETNDCYWLAIKFLLDNHKRRKTGDSVYNALKDKIDILESRIHNLREDFEEFTQEEPEPKHKKKKGFGRGE